MSQELVIDVGKVEWDKSYPDFKRVYSYVDFPIFAKFMESYEKNEPLSDELKKEMEIHLNKYAEANAGSRQLKNGKDNIERISNMPSTQVSLEKVMAVALVADEKGENYKEASAKVLAEMQKELKELAKKDLVDRNGLAVNVDGKKFLLHQDNISEILPELSQEQCGLILDMANQNMVGDAGFFALSYLASRSNKVLSSLADDNEILLGLTIKGGKVILSSSQSFKVRDLNNAKKDNKIQSSLYMDITNLRGDKFTSGAASDKVTMKIGYKSLKGNNSELLSQLVSTISNPGKSISYDDEIFRAQISEQRKEIGKFSNQVRNKDHQQTLKSVVGIKARESKLKKHKLSNPIERKAKIIHELDHSPEFIADMMGQEYSKKTSLWKEYRKYISNEKLKDSPENQYEASAKIYNQLESDQDKKVEYGAKLLVQSSREPGGQIKASDVEKILTPLIPKEKVANLKKNANMIARSVTETKKLSYKNRFLKIVDRIYMGCGMVPENISKITKVVRAEKKKGREVKKGGFVERLLNTKFKKKQQKTTREV